MTPRFEARDLKPYVGRKVAEGIKGARFVELESANHVLLGDEPAWREFARQTRAFLESD